MLENLREMLELVDFNNSVNKFSEFNELNNFQTNNSYLLCVDGIVLENIFNYYVRFEQI